MKEREAAIAAIASTDVLLVALDFDGTLAPLVDNPGDSRMTARARAALTRLAALENTHVALVSGRSLADLTAVAEVAPSSGWLLFGSHGAESNLEPAEERSGASDEVIASHARAVADVMAGLAGIRVEPKKFGFAVHSRLADAEATTTAAERAREYAAEHLESWRVREGKDVVEYAERAEGKDVAVRALQAAVSATATLFAGDDVTDEDAISALGPGDLGVRVGGGVSAATVHVADADAMAGLLNDLATARTNAGFLSQTRD